MFESRVPEMDAMRVRLTRADATLTAELRKFSVGRVTDLEIWIMHGPTGEEFQFVHDGHRIVGGPTYAPGPLRTDPDDPEIDLLEESARHVAREFLRRNRT
jgi:hypothetical protein